MQMFCMECGTSIDTNARFCQKCGTGVNLGVAEIKSHKAVQHEVNSISTSASLPTAETTDSWALGKILKYVLLPKPKDSPKAGKKEIALRLGIFVFLGVLTWQFSTWNKSPEDQLENQNEKVANGLAAYRKQDYDTAFREFQLLAEKGNAYAQYRLGSMYDSGRGISQNNIEAMKWYRKAAEQGLSEAQNNLGVMYDTGQGVPQDIVEAVKWYSKAAAQGNENAQRSLEYAKNRARNNSGQGILETINPEGVEAIRQNEKIRAQAMDYRCQMLQNAFGSSSSPIAQYQLEKAGCL